MGGEGSSTPSYIQLILSYFQKFHDKNLSFLDAAHLHSQVLVTRAYLVFCGGGGINAPHSIFYEFHSSISRILLLNTVIIPNESVNSIYMGNESSLTKNFGTVTKCHRSHMKFLLQCLIMINRRYRSDSLP